jgi:hypothetical protein
MADPVITFEQIKEYTELDLNEYQDLIQKWIPLAQAEVNSALNDSYVLATHGKEIEYRAAVCLTTLARTIKKMNLFSLEDIGHLSEDTVDRVYLDMENKEAYKQEFLEDAQRFINVILEAMEDEGTDLGEIEDGIKIGGLTFIPVGGNDAHITDYGKGMQNDDDNLREALDD